MGFQDPVVGGVVLRRPAIASPDFATGVQGWSVNQDGTAEFQDLTARGTITGSTFIVYGNGGVFIYSFV
jgi:hypothetical protein